MDNEISKFIPRSFNLGGTKMRVELVNIFDTTLGNCSTSQSVIQVAKQYMIDNKPKEQSEQSMINTFYHELVHGILQMMAEFELDENEKFVQNFANLLCEAMKSAEYNDLQKH